MSYQIKSTPFFQRMLSKSKVNGQLQMLKDEFERMNLFDDRDIEKKMREVRLKRLFKEIDKIRELNSEKPKLNSKAKPRSEESERFENLKKARSLGQYYSQWNLKNATISNGALGEKQQFDFDPKLKTESTRKRRIEYGNEISDWNMRRIKSKKCRNDFVQENIKEQEKKLDKKAFNGRKVYSNSIYTSSHKKKKTNYQENQCCSKQPTLPIEGVDNPSVINLRENVQYIDVDKIDENMFKSCNDLHEAILIDTDNIQLALSCSAYDNFQTKRGIQLWQKLFVLLKRHIRMTQKMKTVEFLNNKNSKLCMSDYQLRSISNGTDLPQTDVIPSRIDQFNKNRIEEDEESNSERFISNEYMFAGFSQKILDDELPRYPPPPPSPPPISLPIFSHKIYNPFQPITKSSQTNVKSNTNDSKKENFKLKVETLKSFFEHQGK